jgi:type II secretory pathway pseudopilin PulG
MRTHRGTTLIELLVIMSATTVVLSLTSVLLHRAMRTQQQARAQADVERSALRLAEQFRRDVHQARAADVDEANLGNDVFLLLDLVDDRTAAYSLVDGTVLRVLSQENKPVAREEFAFPAQCQLDIRQAESPTRFVLTITAAASQIPAADVKQPLRMSPIPASFQAEAVVGRDLRFAAVAADREESE